MLAKEEGLVLRTENAEIVAEITSQVFIPLIERPKPLVDNL